MRLVHTRSAPSVVRLMIKIAFSQKSNILIRSYHNLVSRFRFEISIHSRESKGVMIVTPPVNRVGVRGRTTETMSGIPMVPRSRPRNCLCTGAGTVRLRSRSRKGLFVSRLFCTGLSLCFTDAANSAYSLFKYTFANGLR